MKMYSSWIARASGPHDATRRLESVFMSGVTASVTRLLEWRRRGRHIQLLLITIVSITVSITYRAILDTCDINIHVNPTNGECLNCLIPRRATSSSRCYMSEIYSSLNRAFNLNQGLSLALLNAVRQACPVFLHQTRAFDRSIWCRSVLTKRFNRVSFNFRLLLYYPYSWMIRGA